MEFVEFKKEITQYIVLVSAGRSMIGDIGICVFLGIAEIGCL